MQEHSIKKSLVRMYHLNPSKTIHNRLARALIRSVKYHKKAQRAQKEVIVKDVREIKDHKGVRINITVTTIVTNS